MIFISMENLKPKFFLSMLKIFFLWSVILFLVFLNKIYTEFDINSLLIFLNKVHNGKLNLMTIFRYFSLKIITFLSFGIIFWYLLFFYKIKTHVTRIYTANNHRPLSFSKAELNKKIKLENDNLLITVLLPIFISMNFSDINTLFNTLFLMSIYLFISCMFFTKDLLLPFYKPTLMFYLHGNFIIAIDISEVDHIDENESLTFLRRKYFFNLLYIYKSRS